MLERSQHKLSVHANIAYSATSGCHTQLLATPADDKADVLESSASAHAPVRRSNRLVVRSDSRNGNLHVRRKVICFDYTKTSSEVKQQALCLRKVSRILKSSLDSHGTVHAIQRCAKKNLAGTWCVRRHHECFSHSVRAIENCFVGKATSLWQRFPREIQGHQANIVSSPKRCLQSFHDSTKPQPDS